MKDSIKSFLLKTSLLLLGVATSHAGNFSVVHSFGITNNATGFYPLASLTPGSDGVLYGISGPGGATEVKFYGIVQKVDNNVFGSIFAINPDGTGFRNLHIFTNPLDGSNAFGGMVLVGDTLYGTTYSGGSQNGGVVFRINTNGTSFTHLYDFGSVTNDGLYPGGTLIYSSGVLYGTTRFGGLYNKGTVFSISTSGGTPSYLVHFNGTNGASPYAGVILSSNILFGTAPSGGAFGGGVIFKVGTSGSGFSVLQDSGTQSPLFLANNLLYGCFTAGGSGGEGSIFSLNMDGSGFTNVYSFSFSTNRGANGTVTNSDGIHPGPLTLVSNSLYGMTYSGGTNGFGTLFSVNTNGSGFVTLYNFTPSSGYPLSWGTILFNNRLYGTVTRGGYGYGCLFSMNTDGSAYTNFLNFAGSDGWGPAGELLVTNGLLFGATTFGGASGYGMLYQLSTNGTGYTNIHSFNADTSLPNCGLIQLSNTIYGATGSWWNNTAAIFAMNPDGSGYTNIYFNDYGNLTSLVAAAGKLFGQSGTGPYMTVFSLGTNGQNDIDVGGSESYASPLAAFGDVVYGTITGDPGMPYGYIYSIDASGSHSVYIFPSAIDGKFAAAPPLLVGGTFYGTTALGGIYTNGSVYSVGTNGSNFTILHSFSNADGRNPYAPLILLNGVLYGTTYLGGPNNQGNIFSVNTDGTGFAVHHSFTGGTDGGSVATGLHLSGNTLYGSSPLGGDMGMGVVFAITAQPVLSSQIAGGNLILSWPDPTFSLQSAPAATGSYTTIAGATSPFTNALSGTQLFFRLISN